MIYFKSLCLQINSNKLNFATKFNFCLCKKIVAVSILIQFAWLKRQSHVKVLKEAI